MKHILTFILLLCCLGICAEHNCPQRIAPGDARTRTTVQPRMAQMSTMTTTTIGTLSLPPRVPVIMVNFSN